jgi:hypothetical protein
LARIHPQTCGSPSHTSYRAYAAIISFLLV